MEGRGNLMFSQRNNPYCEYFKISSLQRYVLKNNKQIFLMKF